MESSDDEGTTAVQYVTNYSFLDDKDNPVSFSILPIHWSDGDHKDSINQIVLTGKADGGFQKIYKHVIGWKMDLSGIKPEISVLTKERDWLMLQKPQYSFVKTIQTILVTVHFLHCLKRKPERPGNSIWDYLRKVFSSFDIVPSENDLLAHLTIIVDTVKYDDTLPTSKYLCEFLENPKKRKVFVEDNETDVKKSKFIVEEDEELDEAIGEADGYESEEETDLFDSVCAMCDDGGEILCCEGRCMRSFHALRGTGTDSQCETLGYSKSQLEAIQNFMCPNCTHKIHSCYVCGKLGSSDKSAGAEVFPCASATCGYFYHPRCVANLLYVENGAEAGEFEKKIAAGESFTCPVHKCHICKEHENKDVRELQFALCRRCPKAYHRKCLPRRIAFENNEDENIITRAWQGLLTNNRILIYCLKHKIDEDIGTPVRTHIKFPYDNRPQLSDLRLSKSKSLVKTGRLVSDGPTSERREKHLLGQGVRSLEKSKLMGTSRKPLERSKLVDISRKPFKEGIKSLSVKTPKPLMPDSLGERRLSDEKSIKAAAAAPKGKSISVPLLDNETKQRLIALMESKSFSITLKDVTKNHRVPSTHANSLKYTVDKDITMGKVEHFVEAVRTASKKLDDGGSIEDAKAICAPDVLQKIDRWKNKLSIYLAPFLHGMRYTSFGRHFTKVDKLKEIVDMLHWYVQNGDTIVDFCCGSNDFSQILKEKLLETGKKCSFRNFDIIRPKNDFDFEERDWMEVKRDELPTGSKLIMGLNPPFGYKAALANKFINKALEFKPKLVILIVPPETERLDRKRLAYDLVWVDKQKLAGLSFYLPGSVDKNNNQMEQWNATPPPLYLWSHPNFTEKHKAIALRQGHSGNEVEQSHKEAKEEPNVLDTSPMEIPMDVSSDHDDYGNISTLFTGQDDISNQNTMFDENNIRKCLAIAPKSQNKSSPKTINVEQSRRQDHVHRKHSSHGLTKSVVQKNTKETRDKGSSLRGISDTRPDARNDDPDCSLFRPTDLCHPSGSHETFSVRAEIEENIRNFCPNQSSTSENLDDLETRYSSGTFRGFGRNHGPNSNEIDEKYSGGDVGRLIQNYGGLGHDSFQERNYIPQDTRFGILGSTPSAQYMPLASVANTSYNPANSSAMNRYAPRLDELNYGRTGNFGVEMPPVGRNSMYSTPGQLYPPRTQASFPPDNSFGFSQGPPRLYSYQNSSGWLNE